MNNHEIFALVFIAFVVFGPLVCAFFELGGLNPLAEKIIRYIDSRNKKDI